LPILALGVNKAADHYRVLDERTREKMATGEYVEEMASGRQDRRRAPAADGGGRRQGPRGPAAPARPGRDPRAPGKAGRPWTRAQQDLALIYNARGLKPDEIADKLGLRTYTVTQMILEGRSRAKP
jgi:hypothetical protein